MMFSIWMGHFEYCVMLYELSCTLCDQCLINDMLRDMLSHYVIAYIDNILTYFLDEENHVKHVKAVPGRLLDNHLYVKAEKCEFYSGA